MKPTKRKPNFSKLQAGGPCPVAALMHKAERLRQAREKFEEPGMMEINDALNEIDDAFGGSRGTCRSLPGPRPRWAIFQLMLAHARLDFVMNATDHAHLAKDFLDASRLLRSVREAMSAAAGAAPSAIISRHQWPSGLRLAR